MKPLDQQVTDFLLAQLTEKLPALSPAFSLLPFRKLSVSGLGTDGEVFWYGEKELFGSFDAGTLAFCFLHVLTHVLFFHFLPEKKADPARWDLAADIAACHFVDTYLLPDTPGCANRREVYRALGDVLSGDHRIFFSAEEIYPVTSSSLPFSTELFSPDDHRFWYFAAIDSALAGDSPIGNSAVSAGGSPSGNSSALSPSDDSLNSNSGAPSPTGDSLIGNGAASPKRLDAIRRTLALLERNLLLSPLRRRPSHGAAPGSRLEQILLQRRGSYDFRRYLRRFSITREETKVDLDSFDYIPYYYGLTHYRNMPFLEPLEYRNSSKIRDLVIAIDTSGSCSRETVTRFLDETLSILSDKEHFFEQMNVHLIQCDSMIQSHTVIHSRSEWLSRAREIQILGRGGTDFTPVFDYVEKLQQKGELTNMKGLLYFTDGDGIYPTKPTPYETAFVFTDFAFLNYKVPSFITKLCLNMDQAGNEVFDYEH